MKELVEKLRDRPKDYAGEINPYVCTVSNRLALQAADAIERLQAENERLKRAIQEWVDGKCISKKYLLMIGKLQRDIPQNCDYCRYKRKDGGCKLLPDGDRFSPDYTEGFDRDECEHWEWRGFEED